MHFLKHMKILLCPKDILKIRNCCTASVSVNNFDLSNITANAPKRINAFDTVHEDLSGVTPYFPKSFNLAAYVNSSEVLQNLVHLNVNLSKIEKKPYIAERILKLDLVQDIKQHVLFIKDYVDVDSVGDFITKNPMILCEPLLDLEVRVNYLKSKCFSNSQIQRVISKNPFWLMFSTTRIDNRLGYFQQNFKLSGMEVRALATQQPKIITYNLHHIRTNTFVVKEEMGFTDVEVKQLILTKPKIWMLNQKALLERFNYIHNIIKIPHSTLLKYPEVLLCRNFRIKQRHIFLEKLGRAQFNPNKENYVPLKALVEDTDTEFCKNYAKCNVDDFNLFLKTL